MCPPNQPNGRPKPAPAVGRKRRESYCIALTKCVTGLFKAEVIKQFRVLKTVGLNRPSHRFESPKLGQNGVLPFSIIDSAETPISFLVRTTEHPNDRLIIAERLIVVWTSARLLLGGIPSEPVAKTFQNGFDRAAAVVGQRPVIGVPKAEFPVLGSNQPIAIRLAAVAMVLRKLFRSFDQVLAGLEHGHRIRFRRRR